MAEATRSVLTVQAPVPLLTANRVRSMHFHERSKLVRHWRWGTRIYAIAAHIPPYQTAELEFHVILGRKKRRRMPYHDAFAPTIKAVIDGMVDAGVFANDGPTTILSSQVNAGTWGNSDCVVVEIVGQLKESAA